MVAFFGREFLGVTRRKQEKKNKFLGSFSYLTAYKDRQSFQSRSFSETELKALKKKSLHCSGKNDYSNSGSPV